jgi:spermidine synthase
VRRAGNSIRLYTDGVFHSQFNPNSPFSANLWTLQLLPACLRPVDGVRRVLVLGVGGGAVIRSCHELLEPQVVVGIDNCATHLAIARRFFGISSSRAELVHADARTWLEEYAGPPFDLIIDDLFGEDGGEPVRALEVDRSWLETLARHLANEGVLTINFVEPRQLRDAVKHVQENPLWGFQNVFRLTLPTYENAIGAFVRARASASGLRAAVEGLSPRLARSVLAASLQVRRLGPKAGDPQRRSG